MPLYQPDDHEISVHKDRLHLGGEPVHTAYLADKVDTDSSVKSGVTHYRWVMPFEQGHKMLLSGYFHRHNGALYEEDWDGNGQGENGRYGLEMRAVRKDCGVPGCDNDWRDWEHQDHAVVPLDRHGSSVKDAFTKNDVMGAVDHVATQPGGGTSSPIRGF